MFRTENIELMLSWSKRLLNTFAKHGHTGIRIQHLKLETGWIVIDYLNGDEHIAVYQFEDVESIDKKCNYIQNKIRN